MKNRNILISITIIIFLFIYSCGKIGTEGPVGPAGPSLTGSIVGFVSLVDEFGVSIADKSGVIVTVDGFQPGLTAITNSDGRYQLDNLQTGTYDLVFSKNGYVTRIALSVLFLGGVKPIVYNVTLGQKTTTVVSGLTLTPTSSTTLTIGVTVSPAIPTGYARYVRFYYGKSNTVSYTNYVTTNRYSVSTSPASINMSWDKVNYPTGSTLYVIAYGETNTSYSTLDLASGLSVYSTLSATGTSVVSVVVP